MKVWTPLLLSAALSAGCLTLLPSSPARAQASINDCEKIQAADAYNQCLAKFGPPAKKTMNLEPERPGDVKAGPEEAAKGAGTAKGGRRVAGHRRGGRGTFARRGRGGGHVARGGGKGRKRMTITVGK